VNHLPESATAAAADLGALSGLAPALASTFVALAGDIALVIDTDGVVRNVAAAEAGLGVAAQAWIGRPWAETSCDATRRKVEQLLGEARDDGRSRRREVNHPCVAGADIPVAWAAVRLGAQGPVLALGRDLRAASAIQQRFMETQHELERDYWRRRQAEARYRLLFQVANDAVMVLDAQALRVVDANQAAARLFGRPLDAIADAPASLLLAEASRPAFEQLLVAARSSGRAAEIRLQPAGDGAAVEVSATPFRADRQLLLLVRARPAGPTEEQRLLADLVEHGTDAVAVTDAAGRVLAANAAFRALRVVPAQGDSTPAVEGEPIDGWLGDAAGGLRRVLAQARQGGLASHLRLDRPGAAPLAVQAVLLPDGDQERIGFTLSVIEPAGAPSLRRATDLATEIAGLGAQVGHRALPQLMRAASSLVERHLIETALQQQGGDAEKAAATLAISRDSLDLRMRRLGLLPGVGDLPTAIR
jgi:transcriptional regulator PpsR